MIIIRQWQFISWYSLFPLLYVPLYIYKYLIILFKEGFFYDVIDNNFWTPELEMFSSFYLYCIVNINFTQLVLFVNVLFVFPSTYLVYHLQMLPNLCFHYYFYFNWQILKISSPICFFFCLHFCNALGALLVFPTFLF